MCSVFIWGEGLECDRLSREYAYFGSVANQQQGFEFGAPINAGVDCIINQILMIFYLFLFLYFYLCCILNLDISIILFLLITYWLLIIDYWLLIVHYYSGHSWLQHLPLFPLLFAPCLSCHGRATDSLQLLLLVSISYSTIWCLPTEFIPCLFVCLFFFSMA